MAQTRTTFSLLLLAGPLRFALVLVMVAAVLGASWYVECRGAKSPEAYLSSPMTVALRHRDLEAFARRIDALASVDERDEDGMTPLLAAIQLDNVPAVAYLLARGADPNQCWRGRRTPLTAAMSCGRVEMARELLRYGAAPGGVTATGDTPLLAATRGGNWEGVQLILDRHVELMPPGIYENPLICFSSDADQGDSLRRLLAAGVDPNRRGINGKLPLLCAADSNCAPAVAVLLRGGADPAGVDGKGRTAASFAEGRPDVIAALRHAHLAKGDDT
jgi:ankyrin repeat protein